MAKNTNCDRTHIHLLFDFFNKLQNSNQPSFDVILENDRRGLLVALGLFDLRLSQLVRVLEILIRLF